MDVFPEDAEGVLPGRKDGKEGADVGGDTFGGDSSGQPYNLMFFEKSSFYRTDTLL